MIVLDCNGFVAKASIADPATTTPVVLKLFGSDLGSSFVQWDQGQDFIHKLYQWGITSRNDWASAI